MKQKTALQLHIEDLEGLKNNAEMLIKAYNRKSQTDLWPQNMKTLVMAYSTSIRLAKERLTLEESQIKDAVYNSHRGYTTLDSFAKKHADEYFTNTFEQ